LIETAKANRIEPYRYLRYVFTKLPLAKNKNDYRLRWVDGPAFEVYIMV